MNNEQLYKIVREIGDLILWTAEQSSDKHLFIADRRTQSVNGFYNQTQQGIFFELYYGAPSSLWTPWGKWDFCGCSSGNHDPIIEQLIPILGLELHIPEIDNKNGTYGPVYRVTRFKDQVLPYPIASIVGSDLKQYKQASAEWAALTDAYSLRVCKKLPPTSDDFRELDNRTMVIRSEVEGPIRPEDIRTFSDAIQTLKSGDVFKYTHDKGKTWRYTYVEYVSTHEIHTHDEVMAIGVHCSCNFTRESFMKGLVFRKAEPEEYETMTFSYGYEVPDKTKSEYKKKVHVKTKDDEYKDMSYEEALEAWAKKLADETISFSEHEHASGFALWQARFWVEGDVMLYLCTGELLDFTL